MIKKIVFLEPKTEKKHIYSKFDLPRLGNIILATIMKNKNCDVKAYFLEESEIYRRFDGNLTVDLMAISTITATALVSYRLADYFRSKGIKVVIGGPHVTFNPKEALEHADFCIMGEGEKALPMLVDALNNQTSLKEVPGLAWKDDYKEIIINEIARPIDNLDSIPYPDFTLLDSGGKVKSLGSGGRKEIIPIQTSRGCPFGCTFCSVTPMFGRRFRYRSVQNVIGELKKYNPQKHSIFFYDDNFTSNVARAKELLREMIRLGLNFRWSTQVRTDVVKDPELLDLMVKAGCKLLYIGFESIDPEALKEMKKHQSVEEIKLAIKEIRKRRIHIHGMFVFGFDVDTLQTLRATVDFTIKEKIDTVQFLILTPFPGTEFYSRLENENRLIDYQWDEYEGHHVKFLPKKMSVWELQQAQIEAHRRFYTFKQVILRLLRGRIWAYFIGIYANKLNRRWVKWESTYLKGLKSFNGIKKISALMI